MGISGGRFINGGYCDAGGDCKAAFYPQTVIAADSQICCISYTRTGKREFGKKLSEGRYIESRYAEAHIPRQYIIEYYLMYTFCFLAFFASIWILRSLLSEITKDQVAGTLGAMLFAVIFPFFEVLGGYYYDIFELLFMFWGSQLALHGNYVALLLLAPIAEANKESFLFFLATLYPLNRTHFRRVSKQPKSG